MLEYSLKTNPLLKQLSQNTDFNLILTMTSRDDVKMQISFQICNIYQKTFRSMYHTTMSDLKNFSTPTLTPDYDVMGQYLVVSDVINTKIF